MAGRVIYQRINCAFWTLDLCPKHVQWLHVNINNLPNAHWLTLQFSLNFPLDSWIVFSGDKNLKINFICFIRSPPKLVIDLFGVETQLLRLHMCILKLLQLSILNFLFFGIYHINFAIEVSLLWYTKRVLKVRFFFGIYCSILIKKCIGLRFQLYYFKQFGVFGVIKWDRIEAI